MSVDDVTARDQAVSGIACLLDLAGEPCRFVDESWPYGNGYLVPIPKWLTAGFSTTLESSSKEDLVIVELERKERRKRIKNWSVGPKSCKNLQTVTRATSNRLKAAGVSSGTSTLAVGLPKSGSQGSYALFILSFFFSPTPLFFSCPLLAASLTDIARSLPPAAGRLFLLTLPRWSREAFPAPIPAPQS